MKVTEKLDQQEKILSTERAVIQSVIDYTQQCVLTTKSCACMVIFSRLAPVEEVDVGVEVSCAEDLYH